MHATKQQLSQRRLMALRSLTQKYGINEVLHGSGDYYHDAWWWCRGHRRPELGSWTMMNCIRVGPFMSEDEATRIGVALGEGSHASKQ